MHFRVILKIGLTGFSSENNTKVSLHPNQLVNLENKRFCEPFVTAVDTPQQLKDSIYDLNAEPEPQTNLAHKNKKGKTESIPSVQHYRCNRYRPTIRQILLTDHTNDRRVNDRRVARRLKTTALQMAHAAAARPRTLSSLARNVPDSIVVRIEPGTCWSPVQRSGEQSSRLHTMPA